MMTVIGVAWRINQHQLNKSQASLLIPPQIMIGVGDLIRVQRHMMLLLMPRMYRPVLDLDLGGVSGMETVERVKMMPGSEEKRKRRKGKRRLKLKEQQEKDL